jgi:hypothetical protein
MKIQKYFLFALLSAVFASCATPHQQTKKDTPTANVEMTELPMPKHRADIKTLEMSTSLTASVGGSVNSASANIAIGGLDSLSMVVRGPLGITVGKLYADPQYFLFYDAFGNQVLEGAPRAESIAKATQLQLSYDDILHLMRGEIPGEPKNFSFNSYNPDSSLIVYAFKKDTTTDYAIISEADGLLKQYQRKSKSGQIIMNVFYQDFAGEVYPFAQKIVYSFPQQNNTLTFDVNSLKVNEPLLKAFRFNVPDGIKRTYFE